MHILSLQHLHCHYYNYLTYTRYRDFFALQDTLSKMSQYTKVCCRIYIFIHMCVGAYGHTAHVMYCNAYLRCVQDIAFPKKQIVQLRLSTRVIEERIAALEQYMRHAVHRLTVFATSDPNASLSLRYLQEFLGTLYLESYMFLHINAANYAGVSNYMDYLHPPRLDDQRCLELIVYR